MPLRKRTSKCHRWRIIRGKLIALTKLANTATRFAAARTTMLSVDNWPEQVATHALCCKHLRNAGAKRQFVVNKTNAKFSFSCTAAGRLLVVHSIWSAIVTQHLLFIITQAVVSCTRHVSAPCGRPSKPSRHGASSYGHRTIACACAID